MGRAAAKANRERAIRDYYAALLGRWGAQHWWPAQSRFEVIVGAFLTQNTAWTNVEKALRRLRQATGIVWQRDDLVPGLSARINALMATVSTWRARAMASASAGTSEVMTLPVAT